MTITIPDSQHKALEEHAVRIGSSVDRVVCELIQDALQSEGVEAKLMETLAGPPAEPMTQADWDLLYKRVSDRTAD